VRKGEKKRKRERERRERERRLGIDLHEMTVGSNML
jgi:hypothetical protein